MLALRGAHVIGIARSMDKAREACASVPGKTTPAFLDLGDFASVVSCAGEIRAMNTPLDGLICNAGIMALPSANSCTAWKSSSWSTTWATSSWSTS